MNTVPVFVMLTKVSKTAQKYATWRTGSVRVSTTTAAGSATSATWGISSTPIAKVGTNQSVTLRSSKNHTNRDHFNIFQHVIATHLVREVLLAMTMASAHALTTFSATRWGIFCEFTSFLCFIWIVSVVRPMRAQEVQLPPVRGVQLQPVRSDGGLFRARRLRRRPRWHALHLQGEGHRPHLRHLQAALLEPPKLQPRRMPG